jgi:hypothetical protein
MKNTALTSFGQHGYKVIADTNKATPIDGTNFVAITVLAASTTVTTTTTDTDRFPTITGLSVPQGATIYGSWDSITLGAGVVIAYMA